MINKVMLIGKIIEVEDEGYLKTLKLEVKEEYDTNVFTIRILGWNAEIPTNKLVGVSGRLIATESDEILIVGKKITYIGE